MKDKELRKDFEKLEKKVEESGVLEKDSLWSVYSRNYGFKELREKHLTLRVEFNALERKLAIALNLLGVKETESKGKGLKKGKKEIEY